MVQKQPVTTIGPREMVDFPRLGLVNIPAKIDTGADSSSIWVSDTKVRNGKLSFVLFGPGSKYYNGKRILARSYTTISVKNSSGVEEKRYKVNFLVRVHNRTIQARFTLSDRSTMNYPVLLGRRLLKNKFVVDVSRDNNLKVDDTRTKQVLIFISRPKDLNGLNKFYAELFAGNASVVVRSYDDLVFWVKKGKLVVQEKITNRDLASFDLVYFKSHSQARELAAATAEYLEATGVSFIGKEVIRTAVYDKLSAYIRLTLGGINVPPSFSASLPEIKLRFEELAEEFSLPMVVKEIRSDRGKKNYLIKNKRELDQVIEKSGLKDIFVVQKYIANNGYIRAYVFGDKASPVIFRHPVPQSNPLKKHLNKPAGSANAELLDEKFSDLEVVQNLAVASAEQLNLQVAGVDLVQSDDSGEWFILEVNIGPQIKSGSFTDEKLDKLVNFIDNELNR